MSRLKESLPKYFIIKKKIEIKSDPDKLLNGIIAKFKNVKINTEDGVRVDFEDHWVHLRKSNTEPIIRIITEAKSIEEAESYSAIYLDMLKGLEEE